EAEEAADEAELGAAETAQRLAVLQATVRQLITDASDSVGARNRAESELAKAREAMAGRNSLLADLELRRDTLATELAAIEAREAPDESTLAGLRQAVLVAESEHAAAVDALEATRETEGEARMAAAAARQAADM